jgi:hypothetical protein
MRTTYKGYILTEVTTQTEDGRFKARAAIMSLDGSRTRSQRFLDLETFRTREEASARVLAAARTWVDHNGGEDRLALPTNFSPFA